MDISHTKSEIEKVASGKIKSYVTPPLNAKDRHSIHELVESFGNLCSTSKNVPGTSDKKITVSVRHEECDEHNFTGFSSVVLTPETIKFFSDYSRTPLPTHESEYLEYYLCHLDRYFDCVKMFELFKEALAEMKIHELKSESSRVRNAVIEHIKSVSEYVSFTKSSIDAPTDIMIGGKLYNQQHSGKWFVSIDVKSANYRTLMRFCPSFAGTEWKEFIKNFTKVKFLIESKYFREVIFGELGHRKLLKLPLVFVNEAIEFVKSNEKISHLMTKIFCSEDEVVYQVPEDFDIDDLSKRVEEKFPGVFRTEKYRMTQIGSLSYFVKEFPSGKREFKNVPKKFIMQCVKYYEKKVIDVLDRKFTDENNLVATYDKDIFDSGKRIEDMS
jgi:hypothetical protein